MTAYDQDLIVKILLAFFLGVIIGYNRQKSNKPAGIRTQMLICVGSALLAGISVHIAEIYAVPGLPRPDPGRLMAQIIVGIGFLGAGVIIKGNHRISGVTTAATIWITAAVGIAIGAGFYIPAGMTVVLVLLLDPLARLQYQLGLKSHTHVLLISREQQESAVHLLDEQRIKFKITSASQGQVRFTAYLSEEKKMKLLQELNTHHIDFDFFDLDE